MLTRRRPVAARRSPSPPPRPSLRARIKLARRSAATRRRTHAHVVRGDIYALCRRLDPFVARAPRPRVPVTRRRATRRRTASPLPRSGPAPVPALNYNSAAPTSVVLRARKSGTTPTRNALGIKRKRSLFSFRFLFFFFNYKAYTVIDEVFEKISTHIRKEASPPTDQSHSRRAHGCVLSIFGRYSTTKSYFRRAEPTGPRRSDSFGQ